MKSPAVSGTCLFRAVRDSVRMNRFFCLLSFVFLTFPAFSQDAKPPADQKKPPSAQKGKKDAAPKKPKARKGRKAPAPPSLPAISFAAEKLSLTEAGRQLDLPAFTTMPEGGIAVLYINHDGSSDQLWLALQTSDDPLKPTTQIGAAGIIHDPAVATTRDGAIWCFWGQTNLETQTVELKGCRYADSTAGEVFSVSDSGGSETFADAGVDSDGNLWVAWQSMRNQRPDIYAKHYSPQEKKWSDEIRVSRNQEGDWEPKIAFDGQGNAWIVYDSAHGNEFNLYLAKVTREGEVENFPVGHSPSYEARADIAPTADGSGFWIAAERGKAHWGLDSRGHNNATGINAGKSILFGKFDIASGQFHEFPLGTAGRAGAPVNLPCIGVAPDGSPWVAYRYFERTLWRIAITRLGTEEKTWTAPRRIEGSSFGQDRTAAFLINHGGMIRLGWTSDLRKTKAPLEAGVYVAAIDSEIELPQAKAGQGQKKDSTGDDTATPPSRSTPERDFKDRHIWKTKDGKEYGLYWGDLHRHTDVSNCRTGFDGCITEHFRYAYDIGKLDFLGTSDHTDIGKLYSPYEWWHNQKMHDVYNTPGKFHSLYVYEREQRWPWGHRNVVFAERGGPIVYIQRKYYRDSIWQKPLPVKPGVGEITPPELWELLKRSGKKVALISHTGATGMGTDWGRYDTIDYDVETLVEIFQGARVSYEGENAPQPTAGLKPKEKYTVNGDAKNPSPPPAPIADFGKYRAGTYQNALQLGRQLGVFTSSDHISTHVSYGGVFTEENSRSGIVDGFLARRTIAATDKIYLNFTCNGELLGSIFSTEENPKLWLRVDGTAPLKRVTIVRNEKNWKVFPDIDGTTFEMPVTDESPLREVENRYYIRVEQSDGNMAWSSPVWVTMK